MRSMEDYPPFSKRKTSSTGLSAPSDKSGDSPEPSSAINTVPRKFTQLPPVSALRSILSTYFQHCQNQPYVYFREESFFRRLDNGELPQYLLMAMIAIAARFSTDPFFESKTLEATEAYGRTAWNEIFDKAFADDHHLLEIHAVQATNMLAVVDFTAGRHHLGWVKIGLAVRFAQSLQLNSEPRVALSYEEEDERRLTFWSVYMLDRLSSCGAFRPPAISDTDCSTLLPTDNPDVGCNTLDLRTLGEFYGDDKTDDLDSFAHTILMASALGRVERQMLQKQGCNDPYPPWDSRSDFAAIYSMLLSFEGYSKITDVMFSEAIISRYILPDGSIDHAAAGHFVFSTMLYHMNQCLLHHPFLLRKRLESCRARVPLSFLREILRRSLEHAYQLIFTLRTVQKHGMTFTSFYGYAMTVAGVICRLFAYHDDEATRNTAKQLYEYSLEFLERGQAFWGHYPGMAIALKNFNPDATSARSLVTAAHPPELSRDSNTEMIDNLLDYGWLSDPARYKSMTVDGFQISDLSPKSLHVDNVQDGTNSATHTAILNASSTTANTIEPTSRVMPSSKPLSPQRENVSSEHFDFDSHTPLPDELNMDFITHADLVPEDSWSDFIAAGKTTPFSFPPPAPSTAMWTQMME
ncbi:uncharacterized protein PV07_02229 [Cladophialophora immunda]|uniref:Xylanolytic transcriptional activator regulatory domain-containing protein n=1 Tax=Cladophialophora immunda TaxID=569365 RepID=A0A0D2DIP1_9EURO|nr:uncharacterized protein PV07_02229 [Cladophialophora immunda]KIW35539.1 hypothetical protein PV07_02229 [Cladophialophora immunda]